MGLVFPISSSRNVFTSSLFCLLWPALQGIEAAGTAAATFWLLLGTPFPGIHADERAGDTALWVQVFFAMLLLGLPVGEFQRIRGTFESGGKFTRSDFAWRIFLMPLLVGIPIASGSLCYRLFGKASLALALGFVVLVFIAPVLGGVGNRSLVRGQRLDTQEEVEKALRRGRKEREL